MNRNRYKAVGGSESAHCCFEATVVDTSKPLMIGGKRAFEDDGTPRFENVCECWSFSQAREIAIALNVRDAAAMEHAKSVIMAESISVDAINPKPEEGEGL